ncbi:MAG: flagellar basal body P-ring protein FlgI [Planctomycetaceae bacterium]|nr:flagellar basal body P-ring protein FlgI [Planctomycetaceae bacterium]
MKNHLLVTITLLTVLLLYISETFAARMYLENVVRVKGQEATTIYGYGIVTGLNGTGDDPRTYGMAARAIMRELELSGLPRSLETSRTGRPVSVEQQLGTARNSALVKVMVTIPATGGRDGDMLDCVITSGGNAKSLQNGVLSQTILRGPLPEAPELVKALGLAWGKVSLENEKAQLAGKIKNGCRLTADFIHPYVNEGNVTFVLKEEYANFRMASAVAVAINSFANEEAGMGNIAKAINQHFVVVKMPPHYFSNPSSFVTELLQNVEVTLQRSLPARVVINERAGIITIDEGVEMKPCVITHKNITAEIRPPLQPGEIEINPNQFIDVDTETKYAQFLGQPIINQKLKALQASLDAVRIPPADIIQIINNLERQGAIIGEVIRVE